MLGNFARKRLCKRLTGQAEIRLDNRAPTRDELRGKFEDIDELGIYLHVPFCRQICPYCPYNKESFQPDVARRYASAVRKEIDFYAGIVGKRPVTSFYIGGGTPSTMLSNGLAGILEHIRETLEVRCSIHLESHPNDLTEENLDAMVALGVGHLSTGIEALQDKHLRFLKRPYTVDHAKDVVRRAVDRGFQCVNVDIIFALPGQTRGEVEQAGRELVEMGVDQVAAYPLFRFPYTAMGSAGERVNYGVRTIVERRRMLSLLEDVFYDAGYERTSVWAFTKQGVPRYCSVTVPLYVGLGASGGTYLRDVFYLNTFRVADYIEAIEDGRAAIALSLDLTKRMQMAGWLYWRIYETRFEKKDFQSRFGQEFDRVYGKYSKVLHALGFWRDHQGQIVLTDRGSFWLHALEDLFSIEYIGQLWGTSKEEPWPEGVVL